MLRRYPDQARQLHNPAAGIDTAVLAFDAATGAEHAAVGCIVARPPKLPAVVAGVRAPAARIAVGQRVVDGPNAEPLRSEQLVAQRLGLDGPIAAPRTYALR